MEFEEIKRTVACDTLLAYLDVNKQFKIHNNDINFQLGVVIIQEIKPIAFYGIKLTGLQNSYTVTKEELPSIAKTCKEFKNIFLGQWLKSVLTIKILILKF